MPTIAILGTLDSKGVEHAFVADLIRKRGHEVLLIDVGTGGEPQIAPDVTRFEVAEAGGIDLQPLIDGQDRGECVEAMSKAAPGGRISLCTMISPMRAAGTLRS